MIGPDDLVPGMWVTIQHWRVYERSGGGGIFSFGYDSAGEPKRKRKMNGHPLQVQAVELPYVVVIDAIDGTKPHTNPIILDLREVRLMGLSPTYLAALAMAARKNKQLGDAQGQPQ